MTRYLADTNVLVDHLRGIKKASNFLEKESPYISTVTKAELVQGSRNKKDLQIIKKLYFSLPEKCIDEKVCIFALKFMERYYSTYSLLFLDALIAATAITHKLVLVTGNLKHFSFLSGLKLKDWADTKKE